MQRPAVGMSRSCSTFQCCPCDAPGCLCLGLETQSRKSRAQGWFCCILTQPLPPSPLAMDKVSFVLRTSCAVVSASGSGSGILSLTALELPEPTPSASLDSSSWLRLGPVGCALAECPAWLSGCASMLLACTPDTGAEQLSACGG